MPPPTDLSPFRLSRRRFLRYACALLLAPACLRAGPRLAPSRPANAASFTGSWQRATGQAVILRGKGNPPTGKILLGIDVLAQHDFAPLRGKRVGLLTHPAGVNRDRRSTIEVLRQAPEVKLCALFGPEHGIYGDEKAEISIPDRKDPATGLPVFSLYGKTRRPTPEMLADLDALVVDLQELGVRSYTYASAMRYTLETCFQHGVEVVVLDRPNPIGGLKVDGPILEKQWMSYVGAFQVPYVHGLTIGELARMSREIKGWLPAHEEAQSRGRLTVVALHGWKRHHQWPDTGLAWIPTSPAIPDLSAAMGYAMTGLGTQLGGFKHGYGTRLPFRLLQYPGRSPEEIASTLRSRHLPGMDFQVVQFQENGRTHRGCYVIVRDWLLALPTAVSFHLMQLACAWSADGSNPFAQATPQQADLFNKHVGSTAFWEALVRDGARLDLSTFLSSWQTAARRFQLESQAFHLYA